VHERPTKGFTLIELLVVVAIIAVLVSILLPSFIMARSMGQRAVCGANLHHLHIGTETFAQDHKGLLFRHPNLPSELISNDAWDGNNVNLLRCLDPDTISFMPYFSKQKEFFYCPGNPMRADTPYPWFDEGSPFNPAWGGFRFSSGRYAVIVTYANLCNINPVGTPAMKEQYNKLIAHKITDDPSCALWTDDNARCDTYRTFEDVFPTWWKGNHPGVNWQFNAVDELEGRNLLLLDGSVTWSKFTDEMKHRFLLQSGTYEGYSTPNEFYCSF